MPTTVPVYLEVGTKKVFAGAIDWPGWCRSAKDQQGALQALVDHGARYRSALKGAAKGFTVPKETTDLQVTERIRGDATTDFGAPGMAPVADRRPVNDADLKQLAALLRACWRAFDESVAAASSAVLRKGPRGGGRELDAIVEHVLEADGAYLRSLGGAYHKAGGAVGDEMAGLRKAVLDELQSQARGEPPSKPRRSGKTWSPRYFVRRSAWHALDHAWEIEDRATPGSQ